MRSFFQTYRRLRRKRVAPLEILAGLGVAEVVEAGKSDPARYESFSIERVVATHQDEFVWLCFPGLGQAAGSAGAFWRFFRRRFLPDRGELFIFHGPTAIAGYSPEQCIRATLAVAEAADAILQARPNCRVGIFCFSAGTHLGFYLANRIGRRQATPIEKLVAIAPGESIAYGIFATWVTAALADDLRARGIDVETYDREILPFTQRANIDWLPSGDNLVIHAGSTDTFIPPLKREGTASLVRMLREAGKRPCYVIHRGKNHVSLVLRLIGLRLFGGDPYRLGKDL